MGRCLLTRFCLHVCNGSCVAHAGTYSYIMTCRHLGNVCRCFLLGEGLDNTARTSHNKIVHSTSAGSQTFRGLQTFLLGAEGGCSKFISNDIRRFDWNFQHSQTQTHPLHDVARVLASPSGQVGAPPNPHTGAWEHACELNICVLNSVDNLVNN